ncbi:MAG: hypothetical protein ACP5XB_08005 [Isosphaeraceae bacterium]
MHLPCASRLRIAPSLQIASLVLCLAATSLAAEPGPSPHGFIPAKGLVEYLEYEGLDAHAAAWKASAAHGILVDGHAGTMMSELVRQVLDWIIKENPTCKLTGADIMAIYDHVMHHGFVIALHNGGDNPLPATVVLRGFGEQPARARFDRLIATVLGLKKGEKLPAPVRLRGRDVFEFGCDSWWFEGNDLVLLNDLGLSTDPAKPGKLTSAHARRRSLVLDTIDGKEPDVTKTAAYAAAVAEGKDIKGFEPSGLFWVDPGMVASLVSVVPAMPGPAAPLNLPDMKPIPDDVHYLTIPNEVDGTPYVPFATLPDDVFAPEVDPAVTLTKNVTPAKKAAVKEEVDELKALGLDGIKRIVVRWGFQDKALLTDVRIEAPAPRKGVVACLEPPAFRKDHLPPMPRGTGSFVVGSFDLAASYAKFIKLLGALDPDLPLDPIEELALPELIGLRSVEDLRHFGPDWFLLRLPSAQGQPQAGTKIDPAEYALVAGIDNPDAFGVVLDGIVSQVKLYLYLADLDKKDAKGQPGNQKADPPMLALEKLKAPDRGYQLTSPARLVPWLGDHLKPTILVGKSHVAIAANLALAREALSAELPGAAAWTPQGELQRAWECLPDQLTFLSVGDPGNSDWPAGLEHLPSNLQMLANLVLASMDDDKAPGGSALLALAGIPAPGGLRFRIDPAQIPRADQVRKHLFPSVLAATVDDHGFRLISREAFPFACVGTNGKIKWSTTWDGKDGHKGKLKFELGLTP